MASPQTTFVADLRHRSINAESSPLSDSGSSGIGSPRFQIII
jgi:hypothetical protein